MHNTYENDMPEMGMQSDEELCLLAASGIRLAEEALVTR